VKIRAAAAATLNNMDGQGGSLVSVTDTFVPEGKL
jgi:hypothetical protein